MRRSRLAVSIVLLSLSVFCGKPDPQQPDTRPDVLLFVIDTLRADHLSCYGYARGTSPNLDAFAQRGVRCSSAFAHSSWTAPSMVSMMTSRYVASDFKKMPREGEPLAFAERLKVAGYATIGFQFNTLLGTGSGFERGFDEYLVEPSLKELLDRVNAKSTRPRLLYFHFVDPHDPYDPAPESRIFESKGLPPARVAELREYLKEVDPTRSDQEIAREAKKAAQSIGEQIALYDGDIRAVDSKFGDVLRLLEKRGTLNNTVIAVAADHGECLYDHKEAASVVPAAARGNVEKAFKMTHNTLLYEELLHVPLLFGGPNIPQGKVLDAMVGNVDIGPTLLDLLGVGAPKEVDGVSLVPLFADLAAGKAPKGRDAVFANTSIFSSVRTAQGEKLIVPWRVDGPDAVQRFDLLKDPSEKHPLPQNEASLQLGKMLERFRRGGLLANNGESLIDDETAERMRQNGYLTGPGATVPPPREGH